MKIGQTDVLAIAPYTKRFGIAFFQQSELVYCAVKTFPRPRTSRSIRTFTRRRLTALIKEFLPSDILVKQLSARQLTSRNQQNVISEIFRVASIEKVPVEVAPCEHMNSKQSYSVRLAQLVYRFPELKKFTEAQNKDQRSYYRPLLAAVALGVEHQNLPRADRSLI